MNEGYRELMATPYFDRNGAIGKILFLPQLGATLGPGELLLVARWQFPCESDLDDQVSYIEPGPDDDFVVVQSLCKQVGDLVNEGEVVGTLKLIAPPSNAHEYQDDMWLPSSELRPASPSVRRLARQLNVDVNNVKPTGSSGEITSSDVFSYWLERVDRSPEGRHGL